MNADDYGETLILGRQATKQPDVPPFPRPFAASRIPHSTLTPRFLCLLWFVVCVIRSFLRGQIVAAAQLEKTRPRQNAATQNTTVSGRPPSRPTGHTHCATRHRLFTMRNLRLIRPLLLLTAALLGAAAVAQAAPQARVDLFGIQTDAFPTISAWVTPWDAQGRFIAGIAPTAVQVQEDGQPRSLTRWEEQTPGAQVVIAIEPGRALAVRDVQGVSRYTFVYYQIRDWASSEHTVPYDLSLYTPDGPQIAHLADFAPFLQALEAYHPDLKTKEVGLKALAEGLRWAADPPPQPGMGRALLWITPLPTQEALNNLEQYLTLAQKHRVRVYIWLLGPPELAQAPAAQPLRKFAEATLGQFIVFSGMETLPVVADLFEPLTHAYHLTYTSRAFRNAQHTLQVTLRVGENQNLSSQAVAFPFALKPPEPVILDAPQEIVRGLPPGQTDPEARAPRQQTLRVGVTFPDGHPRAVKRLTLLVDGEAAASRRRAPFDKILWDLTAYDHSGVHTLQVEVEDEYGLKGRSPLVTVQVSVPKPRAGLAVWLAQHRGAVTLSVVLAAGVILLAVLFVGGRRQAAATPPAGTTLAPPAATPRPRWRLRWPGRSRGHPTAPPAPLAYLVPLPPADPDTTSTLPVLQIRTPEAVLGSDPAQATLVIRDPSVEPIHARLWRTESGAFFIADQRSAAGTWLNYAPVSPEGARLHDGDLVHLGRVGFRFRRHTEEEPPLQVKPLA